MNPTSFESLLREASRHIWHDWMPNEREGKWYAHVFWKEPVYFAAKLEQGQWFVGFVGPNCSRFQHWVQIPVTNAKDIYVKLADLAEQLQLEREMEAHGFPDANAQKAQGLFYNENEPDKQI